LCFKESKAKTAVSLGSAGALATDILLDGTWRLALNEHDRVLSVNVKIAEPL
jgi:hypothetical protein